MAEGNGVKPREGSLEAPTRHPLGWREDGFYDEGELFNELERVFDICHGCRRCFSLCNSFPTLFDLIDNSESMELDGVDKKNYWQVVDHCYLCDLCFMTKCPYVPPHEWNVDFPHLMLRAKAVKHRKGQSKLRDRLITNTDLVGKLASIPVVAQTVNAANKLAPVRQVLEKVAGIHHAAVLPSYDSRTLRRRLAKHQPKDCATEFAGPTKGRVALFATCYCNYNTPDIGEDLVAVFEHNDIPMRLVDKEQCCGMPKLELGDLEALARARDTNIPVMAKLVEEGWDLTAPVPSCVLMFKQELPLLFPDDPQVLLVQQAFYDPFEYLMLRNAEGKLKTDFKHALGSISYQVPCHLRVQNIGLKTRDMLALVPGTEIDVIERCSGHDGTYAVKKEYHDSSVKICQPVVNKVVEKQADWLASDCPMAADQIGAGVNRKMAADDESPTKTHPIRLLRKAYGI